MTHFAQAVCSSGPAPIHRSQLNNHTIPITGWYHEESSGVDKLVCTNTTTAYALLTTLIKTEYG